MKQLIMYHGSNIEVKNPKILKIKYSKDFGYGFYTTSLKSQAIRWASRNKSKVVSIYELNPLYKENLKIKVFKEMTEEWLDFIAKCRTGGEHNYDIIEGPMADDKIFLTVDDFISGDISREAFWELCKFSKPTHQICFCSNKSLKYLKFKSSEIY